MAIDIKPMNSAQVIKDDYLRVLLSDIVENIGLLSANAAASTDIPPLSTVDTSVPIATTAGPIQTSVIAISAATADLADPLPVVIGVVNSHAADLQTLEGTVNSLISDVRNLQSSYNNLIETLRSGGTVQ